MENKSKQNVLQDIMLGREHRNTTDKQYNDEEEDEAIEKENYEDPKEEQKA